MRINEAYEHDTILPYQGEEGCPAGGCSKVGTQCVDVTAELTLTPSASVGTISVACQGAPSMTCVTAADGASCTITMTQQICVSVPIRYGVTMTSGEPTIGCTDSSCAGCGSC